MVIHQRQIKINGREHAYALRKSRKARNILLHVDNLGQIELVVPWRASFKEAERFMGQRKDWIFKNLQKSFRQQLSRPKYNFVSEQVLPLLGEEIMLEVNLEKSRKKSFVRLQEEKLIVNLPLQGEAKQAVISWYKKQALGYVARTAEPMAHKLGVSISKISIGSYKTQWGSANKKTGRLAINWRLLLGPTQVLDYVIAHEVAHLKQANHSKKFWQVVEFLYPEYRQQRIWLRKNSARLVL